MYAFSFAPRTQERPPMASRFIWGGSRKYSTKSPKKSSRRRISQGVRVHTRKDGLAASFPSKSKIDDNMVTDPAPGGPDSVTKRSKNRQVQCTYGKIPSPSPFLKIYAPSLQTEPQARQRSVNSLSLVGFFFLSSGLATTALSSFQAPPKAVDGRAWPPSVKRSMARSVLPEG